MASASAVFFLFMIVTGQGDAASLSTLAVFKDLNACNVAAKTVTAALQGADAAPAFGTGASSRSPGLRTSPGRPMPRRGRS